MTQGARTARVAEEFREVLAEEIQKLKDPRVGFVTVTGVQVTADLRRAWVSYTVLGDDKQQRSTAAGLRSATPHLRQALGRQVRLRNLPELEFQVDQTLAQHQHIEEIIERLHREGRSDRRERSERPKVLGRAAEILSGADEVAIACHLNPDADALGSMLGLSNFLRARGKRRWARSRTSRSSCRGGSPSFPAGIISCLRRDSRRLRASWSRATALRSTGWVSSARRLRGPASWSGSTTIARTTVSAPSVSWIPMHRPRARWSSA